MLSTNKPVLVGTLIHVMQSNSYDCGVFTAMILSQSAVCGSLTCMQEDNAPEFRTYLAHCLLHQQQPGKLYQPLSGTPMSGAYAIHF